MMLLLSALVVVVVVVLTGTGRVDSSGVTLFQAVHQGQNQGNWNVGLWTYNGEGVQIGPVNQGGNGAVRWDDESSQGTNHGLIHDFSLSYNPASSSLSFRVVGGDKTVVENAVSPIVPPAPVGVVNNLRINIRATAGTSVQCANQSSMPKQQVNISSTTLSDLFLDGVSLPGIAVSARLSDNPSSESFTNDAVLNIRVPIDAAWSLVGKIAVDFEAEMMSAPPKQQRIGMNALDGQYVEDICEESNHCDYFPLSPRPSKVITCTDPNAVIRVVGVDAGFYLPPAPTDTDAGECRTPFCTFLGQDRSSDLVAFLGSVCDGKNQCVLRDEVRDNLLSYFQENGRFSPPRLSCGFPRKEVKDVDESVVITNLDDWMESYRAIFGLLRYNVEYACECSSR